MDTWGYRMVWFRGIHLAPIFTIVIGSADGLHFVTHVQEARKEGKDRFYSIAVTLKMVGIPMIITTVTSVAGFMALLAMKPKANPCY